MVFMGLGFSAGGQSAWLDADLNLKARSAIMEYVLCLFEGFKNGPEIQISAAFRSWCK